jgi:cyclic pyranopterin phosphate synthase
MEELTHFNDSGRAKMVDVGAKDFTKRVALAQGEIYMKRETVERIKEGRMKKGDVLSVAQVAGIMASKKTSDIIPMCHNLNLTGCNIEFEIYEEKIKIFATVSVIGQTGVEMEALTSVSVCALTIYDMCKAIDKDMRIDNICLLEKSGGKSGNYKRKAED